LERGAVEQVGHSPAVDEATEQRMAHDDVKQALEATREIELTVTGRRSGREVTIPAWFVREGDTLA
jgi:hypothetical protein